MGSDNLFMSSGLNIDLGEQFSLSPKVDINGVIGTFTSFNSENNSLKVQIQNGNPWTLFETSNVKATIFGQGFQYTIEWTSYDYSIESNNKGFIITVGDKSHE